MNSNTKNTVVTCVIFSAGLIALGFVLDNMEYVRYGALLSAIAICYTVFHVEGLFWKIVCATALSFSTVVAHFIPNEPEAPLTLAVELFPFIFCLFLCFMRTKKTESEKEARH